MRSVSLSKALNESSKIKIGFRPKASGQSQSAASSARQCCAAFADHGFVTFFKAFDIVVHGSKLRNLFDASPFHIFVGNRDIFIDGFREKEWVLQNQSDVASNMFLLISFSSTPSINTEPF